MEQQQIKQQGQEGTARRGGATAAEAEASPADLARRELVDWCERHGLPVPTDQRGPRR